MTDQSTTERIAELEKLAEAATPGPWKFSRESWNVSTPDCEIDISVYIPQTCEDMTGEFIAAANPQAILSLIQHIAELERKNAELVNALQEVRHWFEAERKSISKGNGSQWSIWQCEEQMEAIDTALASHHKEDKA